MIIAATVGFVIYTMLNDTQVSQVAEDFNDLGKLLLGGFAAAIVVALAFVFIKIRLREKRTPTAQFISISEFAKKS